VLSRDFALYLIPLHTILYSLSSILYSLSSLCTFASFLIVAVVMLVISIYENKAPVKEKENSHKNWMKDDMN